MNKYFVNNKILLILHLLIAIGVQISILGCDICGYTIGSILYFLVHLLQKEFLELSFLLDLGILLGHQLNIIFSVVQPGVILNATWQA